jgi:hypothetical protein
MEFDWCHYLMGRGNGTDWTQSLILDLVGLALALKGCYEIFVNPNLILRANPTALVL